MMEFCDGEPFWDSNLTLTSTWPQVTTCFRNTALVWGPCGMLMLTTPFYVYYLAQQPPRRYRHTLLQQIKLFSSVMLIILGVVEMISAFSDKQDGGLSVHFSAGVTAPIIRTITLLIALLLIILERLRGLVTSGVLFIFWFLMVSANIIPFYTYIIQKDYSTDLTRISVFYIGYCFMLVELIVHCFAEKSRDYTNVLYPCPEMESSYLSRLTFGWTTGLMVQGYKKTLTETDVYDLHPREQSAGVIERFDKVVQRTQADMRRDLTGSSYQNGTVRYTDGSVSVKHDGKNRRNYGYTPLPNGDTSESTPLIGDDKPPLLTSSSAPGPMPSLWKLLIRTFGLELLHAQIWKVINDVLILTNPLILKALIAYVGDTSSPVWVGYLLSLGMFVSVLVQAVTFHILNHYTIALGIRVRAALTSAIYRKALTMNNEAKKQANAGEIVNLMSVDVTRVQKYCEQIYWVWAAPEEIAVCLYLLYSTFGTAMFAGLAFLLLMIGLNVLVMARMSTLQARLMHIKDQRIRVVNEVLNGIKILKLYAWEESFRDKILRIRKDELKVIWRIAVLQVILTVTSMITPFTVGLFTFVAYVFLNGSHTLDAGTAFVGLSLFNTMKNPLTLSPKIFSDLVKSVISVNRVNRFLQCGDLKAKPATRSEKGYPLVVNNGTFTWDPDAPPTLSNIMLRVSEGSLVAVVGQVGSGKTSLISAILGDMDTVDGYVNVNGRVAYVPQQAWIQNDTVQNNILFGKSLHRRNYVKVLEACALKQDLDILPGGDKTEIGEKGINLSGGQKQRVSLARAVYNDADIYLLDDPLSAVDSHVGKHIFSKVVGKTGLLQHKTRILVTHGVHWLPQVDVIVVMTSGKISEIGSYNQLMSHHGAFSQFLMTYFTESKDDDESEDEVVQEMEKEVFERLKVLHTTDSELEKSAEEFDRTIEKLRRGSLLEGLSSSTRVKRDRKDSRVEIKDMNKLIEEEVVQSGVVKKAVYVSYARALGSVSSVVMILSFILYQAGTIAASIWLSGWTDDPQLTNSSLPIGTPERRERTDFFMGVYGLFGIVQVAAITVYSILMAITSVHASRIVHSNMLAHVLRAPMSFFDTTPMGRILNRFSQDIDTLDNELPITLMMWIGRVCTVLSTVLVVSYTTPLFLIAVVPISIIYTIIQRFYIPTSRQLRRLESKTRSPIFAHFSETLSGGSIIRTYRAENRFIRHSERLVDMNQKFSFASNTANRWLGVRIEVLGALVVFLASLLSVFLKDSISGGTIGLSVSYALDITISLNWLVRLTSDIETQIVAVERLKEYTEVPMEAALRVFSTRPPIEWPDKGEVQFDRYSTRFRPGLELVLKDVSCRIAPKEKVGIVGRTGAGKSSLAVALFRLIEAASGDILIDGYSVGKLGLHDLREKLTILPQDPVIFGGSLRMNLDPFGQYRDAQIWVALGQAHLKDFVDSLSSGLEYPCGEGGENLSVGQRQLVCLARCLLRKSKILILDEATAAVDMETDDLIQETIRTEFHDSTIITIAHRLNTVMDYDRIIVLDQGRVVDFDSPSNMLQNTDSLFYKLAKDANLV
ncbi:multidrug resistance-associated protein 1-like [Haliotis rufescens]|uniref:multidrug resistance-associated protein 1-like n=1 Tax=Haliotis rufescens TaxID=6454 RepID=UPI00201EBD7C|nr:multidrug resistance-associated protein 1-like [Haliotis rufescens]